MSFEELSGGEPDQTWYLTEEQRRVIDRAARYIDSHWGPEDLVRDLRAVRDTLRPPS